jgi:CubicO group peptidase (beta-lactamase class C family)
MKSIDALIQSYTDKRVILGAAVAILQGGEIIYLGGFGKTSVEDNGTKVTPLTLFAYGSICKTICATLIMRLVEKELLNLDTPLVDYLPDLQFSNADYGRKITLRHLLSHMSGLPAAGKGWGPRDPDSLRRFVYEQIPYYTFLSEPGAVHLYSNTVICIAGHIAEAVTGKFYDDLVQEYVFDPLQMERVTFDPVVAITYPIALPHESGPDGEPYVIHRMTYNVSGNSSSFALGSVSDLAKLAQMYLNRGIFGDQRFLTASSIAEMHKLHGSRHLTGADHPIHHASQGYGLGIMSGDYKGRKVARHSGMSQSYNCFFELFPDDKAGVVLLTNYGYEDPLLELWATLCDVALDLPQQGIVFIDKPATISPPLDGNHLQHYAGTYLNIARADLATFVMVDDELVLERQGSSMPLVPFGKGQFYGEYSKNRHLPVEFVPDAQGKITHVMIIGELYHHIELDFAVEPDLHLWKLFEGVYKDPSNSNQEEIFTVRLQDGVLFIVQGDHKVPCKAISNYCFLSDHGLIEFESTHSDEVKILVWGKATRYYPLNEHEYSLNHVIQYLVDVPVVQQRMNQTQPLRHSEPDK